MKKKLYEKPTMNIVKLQQQTHLMAVSYIDAKIKASSGENFSWDGENSGEDFEWE